MAGTSVSNATTSTSFNQNLQNSCSVNCVASSVQSGIEISNNKGCSIDLTTSADCLSQCDMTTIATAISETVTSSQTMASSDLLPATGVADVKNISEMEQYLSAECNADNYVTALQEQIYIHDNSSSDQGSCDVSLNSLSSSESSCAITLATNLLNQADTSASAEASTSFFGTILSNLTDMVGSVTAAYAVIVVITMIIIGAIIGIVFLFLNNNPEVANKLVDKVPTGGSIGKGFLSDSSSSLGGFLSESSSIGFVKDASASLSLTEFNRMT